MCDLFERQDVERILGGKYDPLTGGLQIQGKSILMIGDSLMRCLYKDLLYLCNPDNRDALTPVEMFTRNREERYQGDYLLNRHYGSIAGRKFKEERDFHSDHTDIQVTFIFVTRCYTRYLEELLENYPKKWGGYPDVVVMNSALWDINRWGGQGIEQFKENMLNLMDLFKAMLPTYTQVIWMTTPPISANIRGGFQLKHLDFQAHSMRFNVMESNVYAANLVAASGYDVLDMHYHCHKIVYRRAADGIHWNPDAVRFQTNILLTHYTLSRDLPLPGKLKDDWNVTLREAVKTAEAAEEDFLPVTDDQEPIPIADRKYVKAKRRLP